MKLHLWKMLFGAALGCLLPLAGSSPGAQQDPPSSAFLSLPEAIQNALADSPSVFEVQAQVDIAAERAIQARSGFMPQIDVSGAYDRTTNPSRTFATKLNQGLITQEDFNVDRLNNPDPIPQMKRA